MCVSIYLRAWEVMCSDVWCVVYTLRMSVCARRWYWTFVKMF